MARSFFQVSCLLLVAATVSAQRRTAMKNSTTGLTDLDSALAVLNKYSSGNALATVVAQLAADLLNTKLQLQNDLRATQEELHSAMTDLHATQVELQATQTELQSTQGEILAVRNMKADKGSTFVRWGRKSCTDNSTLVYSVHENVDVRRTRFAGGKHYSHSGSGSNRLCLSPSPQFDNVTVPIAYGLLYGGEYKDQPGHHSHDVPCSVCRAAYSTTIMIAGTLTCPEGWTSQYTGHLASERDNKYHYASEYVCLDGNFEDLLGGTCRFDGVLFYYVKTVCGSLPCPPYTNGKIVTCAVCSK